jgi:hypothetical protein
VNCFAQRTRRIKLGLIGAFAVLASSGVAPLLSASVVRAAPDGSQSVDGSRYPTLAGTWVRPGAAQWDPTKPSGLKQEAPLTPEYQALFEHNLAITRSGGQEYNAQVSCMPAGMPRLMIAYDPLEFIVTPEITYIRSDHLTENRRIYTDGRAWPHEIAPSFEGYSIGHWVDDDGDGRYDALEVETRALKGPRVLDASGLPLHADNQTVVKERFFLDKANRNLLHDQVTTIDHAYTRPWTIVRSYNRDPDPIWVENNCGPDNHYLVIDGNTFFISADGFLMPTKKDQPAPDLRNFQPVSK